MMMVELFGSFLQNLRRTGKCASVLGTNRTRRSRLPGDSNGLACGRRR